MAAAYIVFFALLLIYVAIMAIRLGRVERSVREMREAARENEEAVVSPDDGPPREAPAHDQERETV